MFQFNNPKVNTLLPKGFSLQKDNPPSPQELNRLLARCKLDTYSPKKLALALENSFCNLSILEEEKSQLTGFVRITTDRGLNANLWDLVALPGANQELFFSVLIHHSLVIIKKNLPGCSVSTPATPNALIALESQQFIIDPGGIRTMSYKV